MKTCANTGYIRVSFYTPRSLHSALGSAGWICGCNCTDTPSKRYHAHSHLICTKVMPDSVSRLTHVCFTPLIEGTKLMELRIFRHHVTSCDGVPKQEAKNAASIDSMRSYFLTNPRSSSTAHSKTAMNRGRSTRRWKSLCCYDPFRRRMQLHLSVRQGYV